MSGRVDLTRQSTSSPALLTGAQKALRDRHAESGRRGRRAPNRALQWLLEGAGWHLLRASVDLLLLCAAVVVALGGFSATTTVPAVTAPLLTMPLVVMLALYVRGLYKVRMRALILDGIVPALSAVSVAAMATATIGLVLNGQTPAASDWVRAWLLSLLAVGVGRTVLALAQRRARIIGAVGKPVLIVGAGIVGAQVARRLETHSEYGLIPIGFLDDEPRSVAEVGGRTVPVLGTVEDVEHAVRRTGVRNIIVAFSSVADARLSRLIQRTQELGLEVSVVPRMFDTINNRIAYDPVGGLPLLSFHAVDPKGTQFAVKHALDRIFAGAMLLLLAPVLALIAIAVWLSSSGTILYRQRRIGRDGRTFDLYKFRSMRPDPDVALEAAEMDVLLDGDTAPGGVEGVDRRTAVGRFLRRASLDELPQLINVLRGEMSVIGPRPERPEFVEVFEHDVVRYGDRHRVKSGITGWAQVHGLRGQTSLAERVELDNYYIAHWSLGLDLKILLLTLLAVFHDAE